MAYVLVRVKYVDEIDAQHTHAIIFENDSKIKMQISPIKIQILKNRLRTYLIGPK
jgi:hypothetical protein